MLECRECGLKVEKFANGKRCRKCYNAYMAGYMLKRYHERRLRAVEALGGSCVRCGAGEQLEFDHAERTTKAGEVAKWLTQGESKYLEELKKCQLLCRACHIEKSRMEMQVPHGGGLTGRSGCKCQPCKSRKSDYMREWHVRNKARLCS